MPIFYFEPMRDLNQMYSKLTGHKFFSEIHMSKGNSQVQLTESSKPKTAFKTGNGLFRFREVNIFYFTSLSKQCIRRPNYDRICFFRTGHRRNLYTWNFFILKLKVIARYVQKICIKSVWQNKNLATDVGKLTILQRCTFKKTMWWIRTYT